MLDLVKYLRESADEIRACIDNKILSEEASAVVASTNEGLYCLRDEVDKNGTPSIASLKWWFSQLRNLTDAYMKYHVPNVEKEPRAEAYTAITEALNKVSIGRYIYDFFNIKVPVYDLIAVYNSLQDTVSRCITAISVNDDPKKIQELRDECLSIIDVTNKVFATELKTRTDDYTRSLRINAGAVTKPVLEREEKDPLAGYYGDVDTLPDDVTSEMVEQAHQRIRDNAFAGKGNTSDLVNRELDTFGAYLQHKAVVYEQKDGITVFKMPTDTFDLNECLKDHARYMIDLIEQSKEDMTPREDFCAMSEETHDRLKSSDKANTDKKQYVGVVIRSSEGKLSDQQGGRAPISPKITDKD